MRTTIILFLQRFLLACPQCPLFDDWIVAIQDHLYFSSKERIKEGCECVSCMQWNHGHFEGDF